MKGRKGYIDVTGSDLIWLGEESQQSEIEVLLLDIKMGADRFYAIVEHEPSGRVFAAPLLSFRFKTSEFEAGRR